MAVVGICGLIGHGKGTVGDVLLEQGYQRLSFADKLKDAVAVMFDWDRDMLEGITDESRAWREQPNEFWSNETGSDITPRLVLQLFGTDCMRNGFYDGVWVSMVKKTILENPGVNYVVPDVRFPNEMSMIQQVGGQVWQVRRGAMPDWFYNRRDRGVTPVDVHPSEWAWIHSDSNYEAIIENNGTLKELQERISSLL